MNWIWKFIIIVVVVGLLGFGLYNLNVQNKKLEEEVDDLNMKLNLIQKENKKIKNQITFFEQPENLLKELKSQFNYKKQGEEIIIIIPKKANFSGE